MARRQKNNFVHGWVLLDKPIGMTSTQAVGAMKRLFGTSKAGHAGTLDPLASGMLPIALGEATKTVPFVQDGRKVYRFTVRWGVETTTDDTEGEAVATSDHRPAPVDVDAVLDEFEGEISQVPPAFSAIKIDGERATISPAPARRWCWSPVRSPSTRSTSSRPRTPTPPSSNANAARAPTFARSPATSAAGSARAAT